MTRVLIVEDELAIAKLVTIYLCNEGYEVETCTDGAVALRRFEENANGFHLIILDLMLPGLDGRGVARRVRSFSEVPILMLTALDDPRDIVEGLDLGADDYLPKPFDPAVLAARVRALLRRRTNIGAPPSAAAHLRVGNLSIDLEAQRVSVAGILLPIRHREFDLLSVLAAHQGQVISRQQLVDLVWEGALDPESRSVDVTISRLRDRLASAGASVAIETIRSVGYRLVGNGT